MKLKKIIGGIVISAMMFTILPLNAFAADEVHDSSSDSVQTDGMETVNPEPPAIDQTVDTEIVDGDVPGDDGQMTPESAVPGEGQDTPGSVLPSEGQDTPGSAMPGENDQNTPETTAPDEVEKTPESALEVAKKDENGIVEKPFMMLANVKAKPTTLTITRVLSEKGTGGEKPVNKVTEAVITLPAGTMMIDIAEYAVLNTAEKPLYSQWQYSNTYQLNGVDNAQQLKTGNNNALTIYYKMENFVKPDPGCGLVPEWYIYSIGGAYAYCYNKTNAPPNDQNYYKPPVIFNGQEEQDQEKILSAVYAGFPYDGLGLRAKHPTLTENAAYHATQRVVWHLLKQDRLEGRSPEELAYSKDIIAAVEAGTDPAEQGKLSLAPEVGKIHFAYQDDGTYKTQPLRFQGYNGTFTLMLPEGVEGYRLSVTGDEEAVTTFKTTEQLILKSKERPEESGKIVAKSYTYHYPAEVLFYETFDRGMTMNAGYNDGSQNLLSFTDTTGESTVEMSFEAEVEPIPNLPWTPLEPSIPVVPETPLEPSTPTVPETPLEPSTPVVPEIPLEPSTPVAPPDTNEPTAPSRPSGGGDDDDVVDIPEALVPLAPAPTEEVVIEESEVPLGNIAFDDQAVPVENAPSDEEIIEAQEVPLGNIPFDETIIDQEVPLANANPKTGADNTMDWDALGFLLAGAMLAVVQLQRKAR